MSKAEAKGEKGAVTSAVRLGWRCLEVTDTWRPVASVIHQPIAPRKLQNRPGKATVAGTASARSKWAGHQVLGTCFRIRRYVGLDARSTWYKQAITGGSLIAQ